MTDSFAIYPSLKDRVVFITGGASGIGAEHVRQFAAQGARVAFVDIADECGGGGDGGDRRAGHPAPFYQHCDLTDIPALQRAIAAVAEKLGPITVLVNNAANDQRHDYEDVTVAYWDERQAVNLRHQFFAIQAVAPMMRDAGGGSIINFGSISWHANTGGMPAYTTAKAGVEGLTKGMARDLGGRPHQGQLRDPRLGDDRAADQAVADAGGRKEPASDAVPEGKAGSRGPDADGAVAGVRRQPPVHQPAVGGGRAAGCSRGPTRRSGIAICARTAEGRRAVCTMRAACWRS